MSQNKTKFFNQDLYEDAKINEIGSTTTNQVISWGVGKKITADSVEVLSDNSAPNNPVNNVNSPGTFDSSQFSQSFNGKSFIENTNNERYDQNIKDVLDESMSNNVNMDIVPEQFAEKNVQFAGYNANPNIINTNNSISVSEPVIQEQPMAQVMNDTQVMDQSQMLNQSEMQQSVSQPVFEQQLMNQEPTQTMNNQAFAAPVFEQPQPIVNQFEQPQMEQNNFSNAMMQNDTTMNNQPNTFSNGMVDMNATPLMSEANNPVKNDNSVERDLNPLNIDSSAGEIDDYLRSNQPLSLMALSGETIDEEQKPKDVLENNKYFQQTKLEDNRLRAADVLPVSVAPVAPVNDVLAVPKRNLNYNSLAQAFVGEKYRQISMSSFNIWASLLGSFYFFYRKMYLYGIIYAGIIMILNILTLTIPLIGLAASVIFWIITGLITNPLYISFARSKTLSIANSNPNMNQYELEKVCTSKGGTSFFLALLVNIGVNFVTSGILMVVGGASLLSGILNNQNDKGLPMDTSTTLEQVITYTLPSGYSEVKDNPGYFEYVEPSVNLEEVEEESVGKYKCSFNIGLVGEHESAEALVSSMAYADNRYNKVGSYNDKSGNKWDTYEFDYFGNMIYYRAREYDGHIVLVYYEIGKEVTDGVCETHLEDIMNSVKEK